MKSSKTLPNHYQTSRQLAEDSGLLQIEYGHGMQEQPRPSTNGEQKPTQTVRTATYLYKMLTI